MTEKEAIEYSINLAKNAKENEIRPNPYVGAVILDQNGLLQGTGFHQQLGGPHAEVYAIQEALQNKADLTQCTLFVSLEPCSHFGKTPPCTELIIQHKIKKVVIASLDPNPKVNGVEKLKSNGIEVELALHPDAQNLNTRFFTNQRLQRPYYILKLASTIDGKIADYAKTSKWISNSISRQFVHTHLRSNVDAILTTYKTLIQDQASLTIRNTGEITKETNVIVIDQQLQLLNPALNKLPIFYKRNLSKIYIVTNQPAPEILPEHCICIQGDFDVHGLIFASVAKHLLALGFYSILTEAGRQLNSSLINQASADELYWFIAPTILNDLNGLPMLGLNKQNALQDATVCSLIEVKKMEQDLLLHYRFKQNPD